VGYERWVAAEPSQCYRQVDNGVTHG
jgi:hypothetical protein